MLLHEFGLSGLASFQSVTQHIVSLRVQTVKILLGAYRAGLEHVIQDGPMLGREKRRSRVTIAQNMIAGRQLFERERAAFAVRDADGGLHPEDFECQMPHVAALADGAHRRPPFASAGGGHQRVGVRPCPDTVLASPLHHGRLVRCVRCVGADQFERGDQRLRHFGDLRLHLCVRARFLHPAAGRAKLLLVDFRRVHRAEADVRRVLLHPENEIHSRRMFADEILLLGNIRNGAAAEDVSLNRVCADVEIRMPAFHAEKVLPAIRADGVVALDDVHRRPIAAHGVVQPDRVDVHLLARRAGMRDEGHSRQQVHEAGLRRARRSYRLIEAEHDARSIVHLGPLRRAVRLFLVECLLQIVGALEFLQPCAE